MKLAAACAIADSVVSPTPEMIIPSALDMSIADKVAAAVSNANIIRHHTDYGI